MSTIDGGRSSKPQGVGGDAIDSPGQLEFSDQDQLNNLALPYEADLLYAYSTPADYYSWRNDKEGSWFIQDLVKVFRKHAHEMHVVDMLTKVNYIMSDRMSSSEDPEKCGMKQISSCTTQLRKALFLLPPYGLLQVDGAVKPFKQ